MAELMPPRHGRVLDVRLKLVLMAGVSAACLRLGFAGLAIIMGPLTMMESNDDHVLEIFSDFI